MWKKFSKSDENHKCTDSRNLQTPSTWYEGNYTNAHHNQISKASDKGNILKADMGKKNITYRKTQIRMTGKKMIAVILTVQTYITMDQPLKKDCQPRIL